MNAARPGPCEALDGLAEAGLAPDDRRTAPPGELGDPDDVPYLWHRAARGLRVLLAVYRGVRLPLPAAVIRSAGDVAVDVPGGGAPGGAAPLTVRAFDAMNKAAATALVAAVDAPAGTGLLLLLREWTPKAVAHVAGALPETQFFVAREVAAFADGLPRHLDVRVHIASPGELAHARAATGRTPDGYPTLPVTDLVCRALHAAAGDVLAILEPAPEVGSFVYAWRAVSDVSDLAPARAGREEAGGGAALARVAAVAAAAARAAAAAAAAAGAAADESEEEEGEEEEPGWAAADDGGASSASSSDEDEDD